MADQKAAEEQQQEDLADQRPIDIVIVDLNKREINQKVSQLFTACF